MMVIRCAQIQRLLSSSSPGNMLVPYMLNEAKVSIPTQSDRWSEEDMTPVVLTTALHPVSR